MLYILNSQTESTKTSGAGVPLVAFLIICAVLLAGFFIYMISRFLYRRHLDRVVAGKERDVHTHVADPYTVAKILVAVFMIISLVWSMVTIVKLKSDMKYMKEDLEDKIRFLEESLEEQKNESRNAASLLKSCDYMFVKFDSEKEMVEVNFEVVPKNASNTTRLTVSWGGNSVALIDYSGIYRGTVAVPAFEYIDAYPVLTIQNGDMLETEELSSTIKGYPAEKCFMEMLPHEYGFSMEPEKDGKIVINGTVRMDGGRKVVSDGLVTKKTLILSAGGKELKRVQVISDNESETADVSGVYDAGADDILRMNLEFETDCGWIVTIPVAAINTDGDNAREAGETMTISDASGSVLFETMV
ncbi:MAG: hypothetical protein IKH92_03945 [Clostridiales bacterium]|nr:hypothetical protein [Clostridiales bacterium]